MKHTLVRVVAVLALGLGGLLSSCGPPVCAAIPTCESNETESTTACTTAETSCRKVEVCSTTIYCRPATADAGP